MQRITKLKIDAFREQFAYTYQKKWGEIISKTGGPAGSSGVSFLFMEEFLTEELDRELAEIISVEKQALLSIPSIHEDDYFKTLTNILLDEVKGAVDAVVNYVNDTMRSYVLSGRGELSPTLFDQAKKTFISKIVRDIQIMREELKMEKSKPAAGSFNIIGDVGVVNFGTVQGSVHSSISKVSDSGSQEIAEILGKFLETIESSSLTESGKIERMQQIDLLANQSIEPLEKRNGWAIRTALSALSVTADLTSLWISFGPTLQKWFGL